MKRSTSGEGDDEGAKLSIGALSRATGIPVETIRTWERRYGFPVPERKPSGHRVYPLAAVSRLRRISEVLSRGHRAAEVVAAREDELARLLETSRQPPSAQAAPIASHASIPDLIQLVRRLDAPSLTRALLNDWARLEHLEFLESRVAPLIRAVGSGWEEGQLDVSHEHFLSERVGDLLRSLRLPLEERSSGPLVLTGSLPGESHALGLQMAALVLALAGCRVLQLGSEVPLKELSALARDLGARAVGVSISLATRGSRTNAALRKLRESLPRRIELLAGGEGAPRNAPAGVRVVPDLRALDRWARSVSGAG
jgi:DNA-binding transcriptional MerR regulator/methylmalonyl-CoA mutase cobalamin-binding subunit